MIRNVRLLVTLILWLWLASVVLCQGGISIGGSVRDDDGHPVAGVELYLSTGASTQSDAEGWFALPATLGDTVALHLRSMSYMPWDTVLYVQDSIVDLDIALTDAMHRLVGIDVVAQWVSREDPFTAVTLSRQDIAPLNLGQDIPIMLQYQPSMTSSSDAGNGIGYTGLRIRGSDPSRVNISIDGIPLNEAESQLVYWVNLPDFASSIDRVQIQRGVGPSANGTGVFGATVNLVSKKYDPKARFSYSGSGGSFGTQKHSLGLSSGELSRGWYLLARGSLIRSDGYIDRASSELRSLYGSIGKIANRSSTHLKVIYGSEETYQAWNGVPIQFYRQGGSLRRYNTAGARADGTFYEDEKDNYTQTHIHLLHNQQMGDVNLHIKGHHTRGGGYFEQYRASDTGQDYGLHTADSVPSDLVRRLWLQTDYSGLITQVEWDPKDKPWRVEGGAAGSLYWGSHWGEVVWGEHLPAGTAYPHVYYSNQAHKWTASAYTSATYRLGSRLRLYGDLQLRHLKYEYQGRDGSNELGQQAIHYTFLNPKVGVTYLPDSKTRLYLSAAVAQREPNRNDFVQAASGDLPRHEKLYDLELGMERSQEHWNLSTQLYAMLYRDELVVTGRINDVGEYVRSNTPQSHRIGVEISARKQLHEDWALEGNTTLSQNQVRGFASYIDNWTTGEQAVRSYSNTPLAFSPSTQGYVGLLWTKNKKTKNIAINTRYKYTGRQYLDNTGRAERSLPSFGVLNLDALLEWKTSTGTSCRIKAQINNLLDTDYLSNGWSYQFTAPGLDPRTDPYTVRTEGETYSQIGVFPQAGIHFLLGIEIDMEPLH